MNIHIVFVYKANEAKWADPSDDYSFWQQINLRRVDTKCGCLMANGDF